MLKKIVIPIAVLALMLVSSPAFGAIAGTAHEQAVGNQGACSSCHIPHKSAGARLWPQDMTAQETDYGTVGALCYYCHGSGQGVSLPNAIQNFVMDVAGDAAFSHGRDVADLPTGDAIDPTLPYGGAAIAFECTTCHNVHDDTNVPFLQDDIDVLCSRCHDDRLFVNGVVSTSQSTWGDFYGLANPGSHPVGTDVTGDGGTDSPIDMSDLPGVFGTAYGASTAHNLGSHLIDGAALSGGEGPITCVTCHGVHGVQADADPPTGGTPAGEDLLVIAQTATSGIAHGSGDARNALCEGCHTGSSATTIDANTGLAYAGSYNINPGGTNYSHPADDVGAKYAAGVSAFPANWPVGSGSPVNVSPVPICESCHTPHPAANISRATILAASGTHITRQTETALCDECHTDNNWGHHPAGVPMGRMADADIGDNDATLECGDCHEGGAHNWASVAFPDLDVDWVPTDNGRDYVTPDNERTTNNASAECEECHYAGASGQRSPTNNSTDGGALVTHTWRSSTGYQDIGEATHYLGTTTLDYTQGAINALTDDWPDQGQTVLGFSRFDGTDASPGHVVCESCHELEPEKVVPGTALLLAYYDDGGSGGDNDPSSLCEGCHGGTPGGGTPHPMTGDVVSRTGVALNTDTSPYARATPEGRATYPGTDQLNCDGCHQPHDADSNGGTYIYDSGEGTVPPHDVTGTVGSGDAETPKNYRGSAITGLEDAAFCSSCHDYL